MIGPFDVVARIPNLENYQSLSQPLWCVVGVPSSSEVLSFNFSNYGERLRVTNGQLSGALPNPQHFIVDGFELRSFGALTARALASRYSASVFEFTVGNKIYCELPLGALLWSGAPDLPGFRLETKLLLEPQLHFQGRLFWRPHFESPGEVTLVLFLLGTLLRPVA